jgi:hypothetical protein
MPCALEILSWIDPQPVWPPAPEEIAAGMVCSDTGVASGRFCPHAVPGRVLAGDRRTCTVHRRLPVDAETGHLLCRACLPATEFAWKTFAVWPTDVEAFLQMAGKQSLPDHSPACTAVKTRAPPRFLAPIPGRRYLVASQRVPVRVFSPDQELSFFLDGRLVAERGREFMLPVAPGPHSLACIDAGGATARVDFECVPE